MESFLPKAQLSPSFSAWHNAAQHVHMLNIFQTTQQKSLKKIKQRECLTFFSFTKTLPQMSQQSGWCSHRGNLWQWSHSCVEVLNTSLMVQEFKLCFGSSQPISCGLGVTDITRCDRDSSTPTLPPAYRSRFSLKSSCGSQMTRLVSIKLKIFLKLYFDF